MHFAAKLFVCVMMLLIGEQSVTAAAETKTTRIESSSSPKAPPYDEKEMERTFTEIVNGGGRIVCSRASRWSKLRGRSLSDDLEIPRVICDAAYIYGCYWPDRSGLIDMMARLSPLLEDGALLEQIEVQLLGCDGSYYVAVRESPLLLKQLEVLSRNPYLTIVKIDARSVNAPLAAAIKKLQVVQLEVGYAEGKCRVMYVLDSNFFEGRIAQCAKTARVELDDAESAIPTLKATRHLVSVRITKQGTPFIGCAQVDRKETARAVRVRRMLKESLPSVEVEQVTFDQQ